MIQEALNLGIRQMPGAFFFNNIMINDSSPITVAYQNVGSYTNGFVTNPVGGTFYPVHNGAATPVYCAQAMQLNKRSVVTITGAVGLLPTFASSIAYCRISLRQGTSYTGATVVGASGVGAVKLTTASAWLQVPINGVFVLDPGTYTAWVEYYPDSTATGTVYASLWSFSTTIFPAVG